MSHLWSKKVAITASLLLLCACSEPTQSTRSANQISLDQLQLNETTPNDTVTQNTPSIKTEVTNQLVWEIRPQGQAEPVSYLIGTVHAPFAEDYTPPETFWNSLDKTQLFFMEADTDQVAADMQAELPNTINPDQKLQNDLGAEDFAKLQTRLLSIGVPQDIIGILPIIRPWYLSILLSSPPNADSLDPDKIMDVILKQRAQKTGRTIRYLESPREQLQKFQSIPEVELLRLIKEELNKSESQLTSEYQEVFSLYNQGDLKGLEQQGEKARSDSETFYQTIILERNLAWLKTLQPELTKTSCSIAVGTLHILGKEGLIEQLQTLGFDVKPVQYNS